MPGDALPDAADAASTDATSTDAPAPVAQAADRILEAAARVLAEQGATGMSMQDVAAMAGVSKGLIHYHYKDKDALLERLAHWLADAVEARERSAMAHAAPARVVDTLWEWLEGELSRGDVRALLEIDRLRTGTALVAARAAAARRRARAATTVSILYDTLGLRPRVPPAMIGDVWVAFMDGLALDAPHGPQGSHRVAFDVFWLAMLSLAE